MLSLLSSFFLLPIWVLAKWLSWLMPPPTVVHAAHGGDPDTMDGFMASVIMDNGTFGTTPTTGYANGIICTAPKTGGRQLRLRSVCISAYTAAIDATDPVTIVLKTVTAAGAAKATLNTAFSIKSTALADKNSLEIWNGSAILLPGESLMYELTVTTPDTAGFGYALTVDGDIQKV